MRSKPDPLWAHYLLLLLHQTVRAFGANLSASLTLLAHETAGLSNALAHRTAVHPAVGHVTLVVTCTTGDQPKTEIISKTISLSSANVIEKPLTLRKRIAVRMRRRTVALRQIVLVHTARRIHAAPLRLARAGPMVVHAQAPGQRVAGAAGRTLAAHRTVRLVPAHRIRSARVRLAAGRTVARHARIAHLPRSAQTLRPPVDDAAQRITTACAVLQARIPAYASIAALLRRTLLVHRALVHLARALRILWLAIRTRTVGPMVGDAARDPQVAARLVAQTRIQAQSIDARPLRRTVLVRTATGHAGAALAQLTGRAGARIALGAAFAAGAFLAARALRVVVAGVRTEGALLVALAVRVALLQRLRASVKAVADHAGRTAALHRMVGDRALGARAAHRARLRTRIGALLLDAGQMAGALAVRSAAGHAGQVLADVAVAALVVAPAHWLADAALAALVADALRVRAAGRSA